MASLQKMMCQIGYYNCAMHAITSIVLTNPNKFLKNRLSLGRSQRLHSRGWIRQRETDLNNTIPFFDVCRAEDPGKFFEMLRMTPEKFDELLDLVKDDITKQVSIKFGPNNQVKL